MDKALFEELTRSIKEAGEIRRGKRRPARVQRIDALDIKAIRAKTGLSQSGFASLMGVSVRTLQNWEQGRRKPHGPAVSLLRIVRSEPRVAVRALNQ
jgi:putative transcriptional regulator